MDEPQPDRPLRVLSLEDSARDFELLSEKLRDAGIPMTIQHVEGEDEYITALREQSFDIILADFKLPGFDAFAALRSRMEHCPDVPFICVSGTVGEETAIELMKRGAVDYVLKDNLERLPHAFQRALDEARERASRRRAEEELRKNEERYRAILQTSTDGFWLASMDGRLLQVNEACSRMSGYSEAELLGMNISILEAMESETEIARHIQMLKSKGEDRFESRHRRKDGSLVSVEVTMQYKAADGGYVVAFVRDITQRRKVENELIAAKLRAEQSERVKDSFIANMSHEIRTPLNIILGYTSVIAERFLPGAAEGTARYFESVQRGGERLMRTVDMILNVSRLQAGEISLTPVPLDIGRLALKIASDHQPLARKKALALTAFDECGGIVVTADEYCIEQALSNLVHNAIKFTMQGGVVLRVYFDATARVCISCSDTGIGIAAGYLPMLFSRYSQEQTGYTRPFDGLGLGLALVKEYLALNNATIEVESEKGIGSTFTIIFEKDTAVSGTSAAKDASHSTAPADTRKSASAEALSLPAVLLIEDDEMTVEFMNVVLDQQYRIFNARSGEEAWVVLHASAIDIILMDISLAGEQTGIELTQEIRQSPQHRGIPIIAVTAHAYDSDRDNCLGVGCDDFIRKPINSALLLERMHQLLAH